MIALFLFHLKVGVRLGVRSVVPLFAALLAAVMMDIDPAGAMRMIGLAIFGEAPGIGARAVVAAIALGNAAVSGPRLTHGLHGWLRHLPVSAANHRRGAVLSLIAAQIPLAAALAVLLLAAMGSGMETSSAFLFQLPVLSAAVALFVLPLHRRFAVRALSLIAMFLALLPSPVRSAGALLLLVVADLTGGSLRMPPRRRPCGNSHAFIMFQIAWRALGWRLVAAYVTGFVPLLLTAFFVTNNELTSEINSGAWRLGGVMSVTFFLYHVGDRLVQLRPVWPWLRSLPWSSARRVAVDAAFLAAHALVLSAVIAFREWQAAAAVLAVLPYLSLRAAAHMCQGPGRRIALGPLLLEGVFYAGVLALFRWTSWLYLPAIWPALLAAAAAESRIKPTRWRELHHAGRGDSLSWTT